MNEMIGTLEAAKLLGVSDRRVRQLINAGRIPGKRVGPRVFVISKNELERFRIGRAGKLLEKNSGKGLQEPSGNGIVSV